MQYFTIIPFSIFFRIFATVIHVFHFVSFLIPLCSFSFSVFFFSYNSMVFHPHSAVCLIISYSYYSICDATVLERLCEFNIDLLCWNQVLCILQLDCKFIYTSFLLSIFLIFLVDIFIVDLQFNRIQFMLIKISGLLYPWEQMCMSFIAGHKWSFLLFFQGILRISKLFVKTLCRNTGLVVSW